MKNSRPFSLLGIFALWGACASLLTWHHIIFLVYGPTNSWNLCLVSKEYYASVDYGSSTSGFHAQWIPLMHKLFWILWLTNGLVSSVLFQYTRTSCKVFSHCNIWYPRISVCKIAVLNFIPWLGWMWIKIICLLAQLFLMRHLWGGATIC